MGPKVAALSYKLALTRVWIPPYVRLNEHGNLEDVKGYWREVDSVDDLTADEKLALDIQERVLFKIANVPKPTAEQKAAARKKYELLGAARAEANMRGGSPARKRSRASLVAEFSVDGGKTCPCIYCGVALTPDTVSRDRIVPGSQGGRYILPNLVPSCLACNMARVDKPVEAYFQKKAGPQ